MTKEEFLLEKKVLQLKHEQELIQLQKKCAYYGNKVEIGMIVQDAVRALTIKVKKIEVYISSGEPTLMYSGDQMKYSGETMKFPKQIFIFKSENLKIIS